MRKDDSFGGGSGAGDAVLSRTCDAGVLGAILDSLIGFIEQLQTGFNVAMDLVRTAIDIANTMTLGVIPWLDNVRDACERARQGVNQAIDTVQNAIKGLEAPWFIKCVGEKVRDGMGARVSEFAKSLDPATLHCKQSWQGKGADAFFTSADKQRQAADDTQSGVTGFGDRMVAMGSQGIAVTWAFVLALIILTIKIIVAIAKLPAVPVGTLLGTVELWALVAECAALIAAFVAYVLNASAQADGFAAAVREVPMKGQWPQPAA